MSLASQVGLRLLAAEVLKVRRMYLVGMSLASQVGLRRVRSPQGVSALNFMGRDEPSKSGGIETSPRPWHIRTPAPAGRNEPRQSGGIETKGVRRRDPALREKERALSE